MKDDRHQNGYNDLPILKTRYRYEHLSPPSSDHTIFLTIHLYPHDLLYLVSTSPFTRFIERLLSLSPRS